MRYAAQEGVLVHPGFLDGDAPSVLDTAEGRTALTRDDVSYASWLMLCQGKAGDPVTILLRIA